MSPWRPLRSRPLVVFGKRILARASQVGWAYLPTNSPEVDVLASSPNFFLGFAWVLLGSAAPAWASLTVSLRPVALNGAPCCEDQRVFMVVGDFLKVNVY